MNDCHVRPYSHHFRFRRLSPSIPFGSFDFSTPGPRNVTYQEAQHPACQPDELEVSAAKDRQKQASKETETLLKQGQKETDGKPNGNIRGRERDFPTRPPPPFATPLTEAGSPSITMTVHKPDTCREGNSMAIERVATRLKVRSDGNPVPRLADCLIR